MMQSPTRQARVELEFLGTTGADWIITHAFVTAARYHWNMEHATSNEQYIDT
jgi:hypothetical protein